MTADRTSNPTEDTPDTQDEGLFRPISHGRMSQVIGEQIRLLVRQGKLRPGDRLPPERDLCERFGVSRVTVREALRALESMGLVDIRVGARGGAFVTAPSSVSVGAGLADLLSMSSLDPAAVTEARLVLELGVIPMVCERATAQDLAELREICERSATAVGDQDYLLNLSTEFHLRVVQAAHNDAIELLVRSLRDAMLLSLISAHQEAPMGEQGLREHVELVETIEARNSDLATKIMRQHLHRTASRVGMRAREHADTLDDT